MGVQVAIALGALFASLAPLVAMYFMLKRTSGESNETRLRTRVTELEEELKVCRARKDELTDENIRLMRKLLENGSSKH